MQVAPTVRSWTPPLVEVVVRRLPTPLIWDRPAVLVAEEPPLAGVPSPERQSTVDEQFRPALFGM